MQKAFFLTKNNEGWILDGYPRNIPQAEQLDELLNSIKMPLNMVLRLDVPDDEIIERICSMFFLNLSFNNLDRWVHILSGRVYHNTYKPPIKFGYDDETGEPLVQREDDKVERVKERLKVYHTNTETLFDYYSKIGILKNISSRTSDEGYVQIKKVIESQNL